MKVTSLVTPCPIKSSKKDETGTLSSSCQSANLFFQVAHEGGKFLSEHQTVEALHITTKKVRKREKVNISMKSQSLKSLVTLR